MSKIGTCDCCDARDVELVRSELAGMETWSCWPECGFSDSCKIYSPESTDGRPAWRNRLELWSVSIAGLILGTVIVLAAEALMANAIPRPFRNLEIWHGLDRP